MVRGEEEEISQRLFLLSSMREHTDSKHGGKKRKEGMAYDRGEQNKFGVWQRAPEKDLSCVSVP